MKKTTRPKLALKTETIRILAAGTLAQVVGGSHVDPINGFIMKDTIIIRTSGR